jgi:hypothetical protein
MDHAQRNKERASGDRPDASRKERRSRHRVNDDQRSGHGASTALSKMKMLERYRAQLRPLADDAGD